MTTETRKRGHNVRSRVSESSAMPQRPTLRLGLDQRKLPPNSAASVYTYVPLGVGAAIGSANLSPVSSINEGSQYLGSYSETQSPLAPTQYSHPSNPQQRQTELFRQRISSSAQPTPEIAGNSTYRDYDFPAPRAPSQPQNAPQHSATFPPVQNPTSRMSPLATWNTLLYDQRQTIYPQADAGTGTYRALDPQNVELRQTGQMMPKNLQYDPSNPQPSTVPQAPKSQSGSVCISSYQRSNLRRAYSTAIFSHGVAKTWRQQTTRN